MQAYQQGGPMKDKVWTGYVLCHPETNDILAVARVAGEALHTAMALEERLNIPVEIYSVEEFNKKFTIEPWGHIEAAAWHKAEDIVLSPI